MLNAKLQTVLFLTSIVGVAVTLDLIRRKIFEIKYSFLWILLGIVFLVLSAYPEIMSKLSVLLGIATPSNALYLLAIYFLLCLVFSLTAIVSRNAKRVRLLNQEIAILHNKLEEHEDGENDGNISGR